MNIRTVLKIFYFSIGLCLIFTKTLFAHPHIFIENHVVCHFDKNGFAGIELKWTFDNMFSSMIISDYDKNKDNAFNRSEIEKIKKEAFENLKDFKYFTSIKINNKPFIVNFVKNFTAEIENSLLVYKFFVPCHISASDTNKNILFSVYDESYYIDIALIETKPVSFKGSSKFQRSYKIIENDDCFDSNNVPLSPEEIMVTFKKK